MRKIKIVADSSCDMFELKHTEFEAAPMKIITAECEFVDDANLDVDGRGLCSFYAEKGGVLVGFEKA
ncbi:MAG: hypothetical protein J6D21_01795 [Clostridia bacterium]|nr:hypothetical protein [Clostridia bacterium]